MKEYFLNQLITKNVITEIKSGEHYVYDSLFFDFTTNKQDYKSFKKLIEVIKKGHYLINENVFNLSVTSIQLVLPDSYNSSQLRKALGEKFNFYEKYYLPHKRVLMISPNEVKEIDEFINIANKRIWVISDLEDVYEFKYKLSTLYDFEKYKLISSSLIENRCAGLFVF